MQYILDYETKKTQDNNGQPIVEVWLTSRPNLIFAGTDEHEAIAIMLYGIAHQAWNRHLNPDCPGLYQGMPEEPIQHAIELLGRALANAVGDRAGIVLAVLNEEPRGVYSPERQQEKARLSELIGNLGTAIAALSRVKHD
jgi:hypothetical protein